MYLQRYPVFAQSNEARYCSTPPKNKNKNRGHVMHQVHNMMHRFILQRGLCRQYPCREKRRKRGERDALGRPAPLFVYPSSLLPFSVRQIHADSRRLEPGSSRPQRGQSPERGPCDGGGARAKTTAFQAGRILGRGRQCNSGGHDRGGER